MNETFRNTNERRVLMIAASKRDERITTKIFNENSVVHKFCSGLEELCRELDRGCGIAIFSPNVFARDDASRLAKWIEKQPKWSQLPIVFIDHNDVNNIPFLYRYGHVTILQQPLQIRTLLTVIRSGIASRSKQYELRDLLEQEAKTQAVLREADQRKDEFVATVAHELRNPLSPLKSALQLLGMKQHDGEEFAEIHALMTRQVEQMVRIVDDLMDASRVSKGKVQVVRRPFNLIESVKGGIEASRPFIEQSNQTLHVDFASDTIFVDGDPARLAQVTTNILNNAAKYTPDGGNIWLTVTVRNDEACIEVRDDGIGMSSDEIASVFETYRQHNISRERGKAGLGIGLTLVKRLIELHDGSITVNSLGKDLGSTFKVTLRTCNLPSVPPILKLEESKSENIRSFRVLVADDMTANRVVLQRLLEKMGHVVFTASDGKQAFELAIEITPEVVITDIEMPLLDGYQLATLLRKDGRFERTTIVALTGNTREIDRKRAIDSGFNEHISKPVDVRSLRELFASLSK